MAAVPDIVVTFTVDASQAIGTFEDIILESWWQEYLRMVRDAT